MRPTGVVDKRRTLLVAVACLLLPLPGTAQVAPDRRWLTLETPHFRITHPPTLEALARRAAERSEAAYRALADLLTDPPDGPIDIVLSDDADLSNGFTAVSPSNRILIYARPPLEGYDLSYYDDWLETVLVHELAHVFHLDRAGPLGSALRAVFGRVPAGWPFFPGRALPGWAIEGLGTYWESALTGTGRVHGSYHEMVLRTAVLEGRFESPDEASGDSPVWPGGARPYVYGSLFFEHLLERYGEERMGEFVEAVAGQWIPFRLNAAGREVFGESFTALWETWRVELERRFLAERDSLAARRPLTEPLALTRGARVAPAADFTPDGEWIVYPRHDGRTPPRIRRLRPDGSLDEEWVETNTRASLGVGPDGEVVLAQLEYVDPWRVYDDLYRLAPGGEPLRLTRGARLDHPDPHPHGGPTVAVQDDAGSTRLVSVDPATGEVRPLAGASRDEHWAHPRWSPDGRWIAASRWRTGAFHDVVVLDAGGRVVAEVTRDRAVDLSPAWSPDGRWVVWSSDRTGIPNLFAAAVEPERGEASPPRQITNLTGGALYPVVDPRGRWIVYAGYHADGWDLWRIPFDPGAWFEPFPTDPEYAGEGRAGLERWDRSGMADAPPDHVEPLPVPWTLRPYSPWESLVPRFWLPVVEGSERAGERRVLGTGVGAYTAAWDLVGRHAFDVELVWFPKGGRIEGAGSYGYAGLGNPVLDVAAVQEWEAFGPFTEEDAGGIPRRLYVAERERQVGVGATLLRRRVRSTASARLSLSHVWEARTLLDDDLRKTSAFELAAPRSRLAEGRATLSWNRARGYVWSLGTEEGWGVFARGRLRRHLSLADSLEGRVGSDRSFHEGVLGGRFYQPFDGPGFSRHVAAFRVTGGTAAGPGADRFHFDLGGASGGADGLRGVELFGGGALAFPLRGYDRGVRSGRHAWSATAEYRFPLAVVHGGAGLFPLHVDRLGGTLFLDGGNAWGPGRDGDDSRGDPLASVGAELLVRVLPFWTSATTLRLGAAYRLRREGGGGRWAGYVRIGPSF